MQLRYQRQYVKELNLELRRLLSLSIHHIALGQKPYPRIMLQMSPSTRTSVEET